MTHCVDIRAVRDGTLLKLSRFVGSCGGAEADSALELEAAQLPAIAQEVNAAWSSVFSSVAYLSIERIVNQLRPLHAAHIKR